MDTNRSDSGITESIVHPRLVQLTIGDGVSFKIEKNVMPARQYDRQSRGSS